MELDVFSQYSLAREAWPLGLLVKARRTSKEWRALLMRDADLLLRTHPSLPEGARDIYAHWRTTVASPEARAPLAWDWLLLAAAVLGPGDASAAERQWRTARLLLLAPRPLAPHHIDFLWYIIGAGNWDSVALRPAMVQAVVAERFPRAAALLATGGEPDAPLRLWQRTVTMEDMLWLGKVVRGEAPIGQPGWTLALLADGFAIPDGAEVDTGPASASVWHEMITDWLTRDLAAVTPVFLDALGTIGNGYLFMRFKMDLGEGRDRRRSDLSPPVLLRHWLEQPTSAFPNISMFDPALLRFLDRILPDGWPPVRQLLIDRRYGPRAPPVGEQPWEERRRRRRASNEIELQEHRTVNVALLAAILAVYVKRGVMSLGDMLPWLQSLARAHPELAALSGAALVASLRQALANWDLLANPDL